MLFSIFAIKHTTLFRHQGKSRTLVHNLRLASLLSFVAGIVNVAGFLAVQRLTTNVTGHFAFFVDEVLSLHTAQGIAYFLYIFFFFLGAFTSGILTETVARKNERFMYVAPILIECTILITIGWLYPYGMLTHPDTIAFGLLFAMGLQNSLVTNISNAAVRTTHLTGLFTDLGIELSQLFFYRKQEQKKKLYAGIRLRLTIILFFFAGGICGGIFYAKISLHVLVGAGLLLIAGLLFDSIRFRLIRFKRRRSQNGLS